MACRQTEAAVSLVSRRNERMELLPAHLSGMFRGSAARSRHSALSFHVSYRKSGSANVVRSPIATSHRRAHAVPARSWYLRLLSARHGYRDRAHSHRSLSFPYVSPSHRSRLSAHLSLRQAVPKRCAPSNWKSATAPVARLAAAGTRSSLAMAIPTRASCLWARARERTKMRRACPLSAVPASCSTT